MSTFIHVSPIGVIWSNLVHFVHFGSIRSIMSTSVLFNPYYSYSVHFCPICPHRTYSFQFGPVRSILSTLILFGPFSPIYSILSTKVIFGPIWPIWSYSAQFRLFSPHWSYFFHIGPLNAQWLYSVHVGPIRSYLVHIVPIVDVTQIIFTVTLNYFYFVNKISSSITIFFFFLQWLLGPQISPLAHDIAMIPCMGLKAGIALQ